MVIHSCICIWFWLIHGQKACVLWKNLFYLKTLVKTCRFLKIPDYRLFLNILQFCWVYYFVSCEKLTDLIYVVFSQNREEVLHVLTLAERDILSAKYLRYVHIAENSEEQQWNRSSSNQIHDKNLFAICFIRSFKADIYKETAA